MTDKTKSKTFKFLSENKSIEDIKKQPNTTLKEKSRHGGSSFKLVEKNNANHQPVNDDPISESEIFYDAVEDLNTISTEKISQTKIIENGSQKYRYNSVTILDLDKQIAKKIIIEEARAHRILNLQKENNDETLKIEFELKKAKENDLNFKKYSYNIITIYDEKQRKKTGIEKIHEEILPIEDKIIFITTFVHDNQSITEEIIHFYQDNNEIEVMKQLKQYENINKYKDDLSLIEPNANYEKIIKIEPISIKDFLKKQYDFKLKPTKTEISIWSVSWLVPITLIVTGLIHPPLLVTTIALSIVSLVLKEITELFSPISIKVKSWIIQKFYSIIRKIPKVNKRNLIKTQEEIEIKNDYKKTIENLTSDNLETKLKIQYNILKQELDNKKDKNLKKLINDKTINHNSNIESENNQNFDSSIKNTVNQQELQPSKNSNHNWNKVKCLLTT